MPLVTEVGRNRRDAFFLGIRIPQRMAHDKADGRINAADVTSTLHTNLVNFSPLTPEFTVIVWQPLRRQMGEIGETHSHSTMDGRNR